MTDLLIEHQWISARHEPPEIGQTSAMLGIKLGPDVVTRHEDQWSRTIRDEVRLSAYPLALWFASSWWRMRWESLPSGVPGHSWRMAHEMAAVGHGFIWPRMLFAADGESMHVWTMQSASGAVRYLVDAYRAIPFASFERTADVFIEAVIARLDAMQIGPTLLHELWTEVCDERRDEGLSAHRRLEAMLGFDPDDCPATLIEAVQQLATEAGESATDEIAAVCGAGNAASNFQAVLAQARGKGMSGQIVLPRMQQAATEAFQPAWARGAALARKARARLGLSSALDDKRLCELASLSEHRAFEEAGIEPPLLGMAIREAGSATINFLPRRRHRLGRRFELARLLGDYLVADDSDRWLPVTDAKTVRQKFQRAFAAEFLCPIAALLDLLGGDFSSEAMDDAAEHFGVSGLAVKSQLVNHGHMPGTVLDDYRPAAGFPYATVA